MMRYIYITVISLILAIIYYGYHKYSVNNSPECLVIKQVKKDYDCELLQKQIKENLKQNRN